MSVGAMSIHVEMFKQGGVLGVVLSFIFLFLSKAIYLQTFSAMYCIFRANGIYYKYQLEGS